jgi:serine/threonine protein kinase
MTDTSPAEAIFFAALERPPGDRTAFVDQACAGDPELRDRIEKMLAAQSHLGGFLDQAQAAGTPDLPSAGPRQPPAEAPGTLVAGKYKLLQRIGEGGMGSVWMAQQTAPVKRLVAVKLIHNDRGSSQTILARFEAERQAIALMDHPHIAKLLDAGTTGEKDEGGRMKDEQKLDEGPASSFSHHPSSFRGGRPYFVMELIKGIPLNEYCDQHKLAIADRLHLFIQICSAVQHAHQKGILHRDLKPTNILVEAHDDRPVPKVIDFGLAKALSGQPLTDRTLFTGFGTVAGTPQYMAPEQAKFNAIDVDTRADIYSLGVILYELLTGTTPVEREQLKTAAFDDVLRAIRENEPPTPSKRLSSTASKLSVAANRQMEPLKLGRLLRGDLDWIVMKALAKERDRRYETANSFARDIERFLNHEPVLAGPPSAAYRLRKLVRRNRAQVMAGGLLLLALLLGLAGTTFGLIRAEQRRVDAEQARADEADQRTRAEKARDRTRQALDAMTSAVTGDSLTTQKALSDEQKKFLTEVLTYYQEFAGEKQDDEKSRARTAAAAARVGRLEFRLGRNLEAATAYRLACDGYAKLADDFPAVPEYRLELGSSHADLGIVLSDLGQRPEAGKQFRKGRAIFEKLAADFPAVPRYRRKLASCHGNLGNLLRELGKRPEAEKHLRQALAMREKLAADFPAVAEYRKDLAMSHNNLAALLVDLGKGPEAEKQNRQALAIRVKLAADFPAVPECRHDLGMSHQNLATLLAGLGKGPEAEEQYRQALAIQEKLAADFPAVPEYRRWLALTHTNLGSLLRDLGKRPEAEEQHRQALAIQEKLAADFPAVPQYRQELASSHDFLGTLLRDLGKQPEAEEQYRHALAVEAKLATDFPAVPTYRQFFASSHNNLGNLLAALGKRPEAEEHYRQALAIWDKLAADLPAVPEDRKHRAMGHHNLGRLLEDSGKRPEAQEQYRKALAIREKLAADLPAVPKYRQDLAMSYNTLGNLFVNQGKWPEAEEQLRKALAIRQKLAADFPALPRYQIDLGGSYCNMGNLVSTRGRPRESLPWFEIAIRTLTATYNQDRRLAMARQFLRNSHLGRAIACHRLQKYTEAVKDLDTVIELSPKEEQPWHRAKRAIMRLGAGQVAEAVAEVGELSRTSTWSAEQWYNFACVCAVASGIMADKRQEYADQAMVLLHKAVKAGFHDAAHMARDTDLDPLRRRDDFKKMLAELAKRTHGTKSRP